MKKIIYLAFAALLCSCTSGGFKITGSIDGIVAGDSVMLYVYNGEEPTQVAKSKVASDGVITLKGSLEHEDIAVMILNGSQTVGVVILEPGDINLRLNEFGVVEFAGTPLNDANVEFMESRIALEVKFEGMAEEDREAGSEMIYEEYQELVSTTVDKNIDNVFGAFLFVTTEMAEIDAAAAAERIAKFPAQIAELTFMQEAAESIQAMLSLEIGQPYIDIALSNAAGETVSVSELLAQDKYVLIDFWATWCAPCVAEMPHLKEAYAKFKKSGFEIYGVSLDSNGEDWLSMVNGGDMPWVNVIATAESSVAGDYMIRTIPSNFLISPDGKIVAKNLRGELVIEFLNEILK